VSETVLIGMARPACWIGLGMAEACATCCQAGGATREAGHPGIDRGRAMGSECYPGSEPVQRGVKHRPRDARRQGRGGAERDEAWAALALGAAQGNRGGRAWKLHAPGSDNRPPPNSPPASEILQL
jgi:hypothetical protein